MMKLPIYQVDAFTSKRFKGNPAAIVLLEEWLPDQTLQAIALENNLSETAYIVPQGESYGLRWFTPAMEIDLCGHATLASAFVLFENGHARGAEIRFVTSKSGLLTVKKEGDLFKLDFPSRPAEKATCTREVEEALGAQPKELYQTARDLMAVFGKEQEIHAMRPDFARMAVLDPIGVLVTAPGEEVDFVSRFFAPKAGVNEDPVTGSAHCTLIPYWSKRLRKNKLHALQVSKRMGEIFCEDRGDRVMIGGYAVEYLRGEIFID